MNSLPRKPEGFHCVSPYIVVKNAAEAVDFYKKAFGAHENGRVATPDGAVMHAELRIGDSIVMVGSHPQATEPQESRMPALTLYVYFDDVDAQTKTAQGAGGTLVQGPADQFYGDRMATILDPFGLTWHIATHKEDVSMEETQRRAFAAMPKK